MIALYLTAINANEDKTKFETVYINYKDMMLNRAYYILKDRDLAEDAVHNAFISIMKNLDKVDLNEPKKASCYIMVITENAAKKMYNKRHKIVEIELEEAGSSESIEKHVENKMMADSVAEQMKNMPDIYRQVLILKFYVGLKDKEIAATLDVQLSTVRKRFQRGKKILLTSLGEGDING